MPSTLTTTIIITRKMAQATTKNPPLNSSINATFFNGFKVDFQSIGTGMVIRYKSVAMLQARKVQTIWFEIAGWQASRETEQLANRDTLDLWRMMLGSLPGSG